MIPIFCFRLQGKALFLFSIPMATKRQPSTDRQKAGLLWLLLGTERRSVARRLSSEEMLELNDGAKSFLKASPSERNATIRTVQRLLRNERGSSWPSALSAALFAFAILLFAIHSFLRPDDPPLYLISLFGPLLIGCASPLMLYLLPAHRRVGLFHPTGFLYAPPAFVALIWLLFLINAGTALPVSKLPPLELGILTIGALLAPFLEEVFFRELIPGAVGRPPHFAGHFAAALLFALLHLPVDLEQFLHYLLAAATLSLLRILTGSLFWPIAVHSAANVSSLWIIQ